MHSENRGLNALKFVTHKSANMIRKSVCRYLVRHKRAEQGG